MWDGQGGGPSDSAAPNDERVKGGCDSDLSGPAPRSLLLPLLLLALLMVTRRR